jgi:hypothetical protein
MVFCRRFSLVLLTFFVRFVMVHVVFSFLTLSCATLTHVRDTLHEEGNQVEHNNFTQPSASMRSMNSRTTSCIWSRHCASPHCGASSRVSVDAWAATLVVGLAPIRSILSTLAAFGSSTKWSPERAGCFLGADMLDSRSRTRVQFQVELKWSLPF